MENINEIIAENDAENMTEEQRCMTVTLVSRCSMCGRELTDPKSIQRGVGPECMRNHSAGRYTKRQHRINGLTWMQHAPIKTIESVGLRDWDQDRAEKILNKINAGKQLTPRQRNRADSYTLSAIQHFEKKALDATLQDVGWHDLVQCKNCNTVSKYCECHDHDHDVDWLSCRECGSMTSVGAKRNFDTLFKVFTVTMQDASQEVE